MRESCELRMEHAMHEQDIELAHASRRMRKEKKQKTKNLPLPFWLFIVLLAILLNSKFSILLLVLIFVAYLVAKYVLMGDSKKPRPIGGATMIV